MKKRFSSVVKVVAPLAMFAAMVGFSQASAVAAPRGGHAGGGRSFAAPSRGFGGGRSFAAPSRGFGGGRAVVPRAYGGRFAGPGYYGPSIGLGFGVGAYPYSYAPYGVAPYGYAAPYDYTAPYGYAAPAQTCDPAGYYDQNGVWQATPGCAAPQAPGYPAPTAPAPGVPYQQ